MSLPAPEDRDGRTCFPEPISGNNGQENMWQVVYTHHDVVVRGLCFNRIFVVFLGELKVTMASR